MGFLSSLLDIFFPPKCVFCSQLLNKNDDGICSKCIESLPYADNHGKQSGDVFDICISPLYYTGVVRRSVLRYKFHGASHYAGTYGEFLADCIREIPDFKFDIITWVPLSKKRERSRGYDQAMLIAKTTASVLDETAIETLIKHKNVRAQSELGDKKERSANIRGAFIVTNAEMIAGKNILLIDDVVTTGTTLEECTRVLLEAGAAEVFCAALARGE